MFAMMTAVALALTVGIEPAKEPAQPAPATPAAPSAPAPSGTPTTAPAPATPAAPGASKPTDANAKPAVDAYVLGFTMKDIDGKDVDLAQFKGQVLLIVNVASKCGYTPQYTALEKLYKDKQGKGFAVLGFPANNFGEQEPGSDGEIKAFCTSKYNVTFPMFSKISVKGDDQHPLYKKLAAQPKPIGGDPDWNFNKFVVDRNGNVVARFDKKVKPDDPALVRKIDELLAN